MNYKEINIQKDGLKKADKTPMISNYSISKNRVINKKSFELGWQTIKNDIKMAYGYVDSCLNKFADLFIYLLKHDKDFKKYKPRLQNDFRVIRLDISYKRGKKFTLYITISKSFVYLNNNPNEFDKNKMVCYYNTPDFILKTDYYLNEMFYKIEKIKVDYRSLDL